ncbi:MAG: hypothetical protein IPM69_15295 [Ignavibacteria bacterium]|nr:hypothetical protein [Ignavibacteria bacterium]
MIESAGGVSCGKGGFVGFIDGTGLNVSHPDTLRMHNLMIDIARAASSLLAASDKFWRANSDLTSFWNCSMHSLILGRSPPVLLRQSQTESPMICPGGVAHDAVIIVMIIITLRKILK